MKTLDNTHCTSEPYHCDDDLFNQQRYKTYSLWW